MKEVNPPAHTQEAETLATLAKRVREREKRSRRDQLAHAKAQAMDTLAARSKAKHGEWQDWCAEAKLSQKQAWNYCEYGKSVVTTDFNSLSEEQQWDKWQEIQGNKPETEQSPPIPTEEQSRPAQLPEPVEERPQAAPQATSPNSRVEPQEPAPVIEERPAEPVCPCCGKDCPHCRPAPTAERPPTLPAPKPAPKSTNRAAGLLSPPPTLPLDRLCPRCQRIGGPHCPDCRKLAATHTARHAQRNPA